MGGVLFPATRPSVCFASTDESLGATGRSESDDVKLVIGLDRVELDDRDALGDWVVILDEG